MFPNLAEHIWKHVAVELYDAYNDTKHAFIYPPHPIPKQISPDIRLFQFVCQFLTVQTAVDSPNILSLGRYKRYEKYRFTVQVGKAQCKSPDLFINTRMV